MRKDALVRSGVMILATAASARAASVSVEFNTVIGNQPMTWGTNEMHDHIYNSSAAPSRLAEIRSVWCRYWLGREIAPNYQGGWRWAYLDEGIDKIVASGAKPMVCFAGVPDWMAEPYAYPTKPSTWNHPQDMNVWRQYCVDIVRHCESRGYPVQSWAWEIWNEPNNGSVSGSWSPAQYLQLYAEAADALRSNWPNIRIGGPSTDHASDGWIVPLLSGGYDVQFITWHRYGAWDGSFTKPSAEYLADTAYYGSSAAAVEGWINQHRPGEGIWNVCGELNWNAYCCPIDDRIWEDVMIPWYTSVMRHLLLNGCDIEQFFVGTDKSWPNYGLFLGTGDSAGLRSPAFFGKMLFAAAAPAASQLVRAEVSGSSTLEALAVRTQSGRDHVILIHKTTGYTTVTLNITGPAVAGGIWYTMDQAAYDTQAFRTSVAPGGNQQSATLDGYSLKVFEICSDAGACSPDRDVDGVLNVFDNCPGTWNPGQADADGDGPGDACDVCPYDAENDADADGVCGDVDNCPSQANPDQADADGDNAGDVCDNCRSVPNADQADTDADGVGDACDDCPNTAAGERVDLFGCPTPQADFDLDGDVDQENFGHLQGCLTGVGITPHSACRDADLDGDGDVDVYDVSIFQKCLSGPSVPANPACAAPAGP